jgi:hypothetical protein
MTKDEALTMALDYIHAALISHDNAYGNHPAMKRARDEIVRDLEELRQALAEPPNSTTDVVESEPVAWGMQNADGQITDVITPEEHARVEGGYTVPLYTAPPKREWQGLTYDEISEICSRGQTGVVLLSAHDIETAVLVESKLKEKNGG